jgi:hypothetical protein
MTRAHFMIEWIKIDGLYCIPRGLHVGIGLHTALHYAGLVRHHRWLMASGEGQLTWLWLRRTGPVSGVIGDIEEVHEVRPIGMVFERMVRFSCGSRQVQLFAPRVEADRIVAYLSRP